MVLCTTLQTCFFCHLMNIGIYDDWFITCCHTHISLELSAILNTMQPLVAREENVDSPAG